MIRDEILPYAIVGLLVLFAFVLMPSYEHMAVSSTKPPPKAPDTTQKTVPAATQQGADSAAPADTYVLTSSLVPCTCPTQSMGCPSHAGSAPSSKTPGDMDSKPSQEAIRKPFSDAFSSKTDPEPYLTSFGSFGK